LGTFQEGSFKNSHYSSQTVLTETQIIYAASGSAVTFTLAPNASNALLNATVSLSAGVADPNQILWGVNNVTAGTLATVTSATVGAYTAYTLTFSAAGVNLNLMLLMTSTPSLVFIATLTDGGLSPLFKDTSNTLGTDTKGSTRYTCYKRELLYKPWSYYAGLLNPGVLASVSDVTTCSQITK
jgi:hypothetical protein